MNKTVAILFGGQSSEHPVSLMSTVSVLNNLPKTYTPYMVGITIDGKWFHFSGSVKEIENDTWQQNKSNQEVILSPSANHHGFYNLATNCFDEVDVVFPVLHGRFGEDGTIQGLCQLNGLPIVSDDLTSSAVSIDKAYTHIIAESIGIPMAKYKVYYRNEHPDYEDMFAEVESDLGIPCYVKPTKEGSSFGAHKIHNYTEFVEYVEDAFAYDRKILLEEFIEGTEVGCAVLGDNEVGELCEVIVETEMYGFAEKYDGFKTNIYVPAKTVTAEVKKQVIELALKIYKAMDCTIMARIDFFYSNGRLVFNELNLIPGFTSHSLYPRMFGAVNVSYSELLDKLIKLALEVNQHE